MLTHLRLIAVDITHLKTLEAKQNSGRGVSCVRSIISHIENNKNDEALACCFNENDKIRNYPDIKAELEKLFPTYHVTNL